jgi:hypothetical protein
MNQTHTPSQPTQPPPADGTRMPPAAHAPGVRIPPLPERDGVAIPSSTGVPYRGRPDRKEVAAQLLRDLAACLTVQSDLVIGSAMCSPEWIVAQVITARTVCGFWERKLGEYVTAWEHEDDPTLRPPSLDW